MQATRKAEDIERAGEDRIFSALGDATRRHILDLLRTGPMTTGEICTHFAISRFAIMKHLTVLVDASLVLIERQGRQRINHLNPLPIQALHRRWIKPFEQLGADRLLRIRQLAENLPKE